MNNDTKVKTKEPVVSEKKIYTGKFISLKVQTVETPTGYSQREIVTHPGTLCLLLITDENKLVMTRTYRKTAEKYSLEVLNQRLNSLENHLDIIKSELQKNLGYQLKDIKPIYSFYPSIAYSNEKVYTYMATAKKIADMNVSEDVEFVEISLDQLTQGKYQESILEPKTMIAINYIQDNLSNIIKENQ